MYSDFFGFKEKPFTLTPNPQFVFLSRSHSEVFAQLQYGIDSHAGFVAMTGEVGTGKTTLLRTLLSLLDSGRYRSALIFNSALSADQLLANVCREFGLEAAEQGRLGLLEALNRFLVDQHASGQTVVLVVDEAQNLAPDVLEQVRMISNMETDQDKLIQIVLAGQPELDALLARQDLRQLNQRITVRCRLNPMGYRDAAEYVNHRLQVAGCRIPGLFSRGALRRIYRYSGGIPRLINVACEQALVMAWTRESPLVTGRIVSRMLAENAPSHWRHSFFGRLLDWLLVGR